MFNILNPIESTIHKTPVKYRSTSSIPYKDERLLKKTIKTCQIYSMMSRLNKEPVNMHIVLDITHSHISSHVLMTLIATKPSSDKAVVGVAPLY